MGEVMEAVKRRLGIGIAKRNEILRLIGKGVNNYYSIARALGVDPGTAKHHLDWLEERGMVKSEIIVEAGRAKRVFTLTFPPGILERVIGVIEDPDDLKEMEKKIVKLVLEVVDELEKGKITPEEADRIFTALIALKTVPLSEEIEELLTIANTIHDGNPETVMVLKMIAGDLTVRIGKGRGK